MSRHQAASPPHDDAGRRARAATASDPEGDRAVDKAGAPHPDDRRKPGSPKDLTKPSWGYVLKRTVREFVRDESTDNAAGLTYWAVLALAPAALALFSLLALFGNSRQIVEDAIEEAGANVPTDEGSVIDMLLAAAEGQQGAGLALITGLAVALWTASNYVNAFGRAMNRVYEVDEGRPIWKLRPIMLLVTLVLLLLVVAICVALVLSGGVAEALGAAIGLSSQAVTIWNIAKWPVVVLLVVLAVAVLYFATPNVKQPKFRWLSVGSVVAILVWALATVGFFFYVANFGNYDATYGALGGVVVFLLWLYITNNALLFGAELDAELERGRELQAGIAAEKSIQLPPRDTTASEKKQKKHTDDVARGRRLRESTGARQAAPHDD
ncbi:YihY/virulence factor BrkB family protein [Actinotalea sp. BY-33]|uniref:YihY/virulence factor BrkB family protein n=1 Tax=Actinotalea soli TaxID=2819234 RepID=A0A939LMR8_9CELL|nr:YihY/virulence factor BrkB family protein [Actinotalea soli]MBO1751002.1 YihY/virulence factor BrkB family protein [Actinotalea soli]